MTYEQAFNKYCEEQANKFNVPVEMVKEVNSDYSNKSQGHMLMVARTFKYQGGYLTTVFNYSKTSGSTWVNQVLMINGEIIARSPIVDYPTSDNFFGQAFDVLPDYNELRKETI